MAIPASLAESIRSRRSASPRIAGSATACSPGGERSRGAGTPCASPRSPGRFARWPTTPGRSTAAPSALGSSGSCASTGPRSRRRTCARSPPGEEEPLLTDYAGGELATALPNSQGFVLASILAGARGLGDAVDPHGEHAGELARIFHAATVDRDRHLCDPEFFDVPVAELVASGRTDEQPPSPRPGGRGDTVAVVCVDGEGNSVSLIQSVFHVFGAGMLDPATGIILHNRGASFSLDPASPNVLAGGKRPGAHPRRRARRSRRAPHRRPRDHGRERAAADPGPGAAAPRPGLGVRGAVAAPRFIVGARALRAPVTC